MLIKLLIAYSLTTVSSVEASYSKYGIIIDLFWAPNICLIGYIYYILWIKTVFTHLLNKDF